MSKKIYKDSNYRFSDPVRFFKANDPYYFEVDNIPLKQLQENCLWLRDQVRRDLTELSEVKREDLDELRPYATGGDRTVRVLPGRYTARVNDASTKKPLAYLRQVVGNALGDVDVYTALTPNPGTNLNNQVLSDTLDQFKSILSEKALGMTGLEGKSFTRPVTDSDFPINLSGVLLTADGKAYAEGNIPGTAANLAPAVITQALLWAKSQDSNQSEIPIVPYDPNSASRGFSLLPQAENFFIKAWRGIARNAIVDVPEELTIEVPGFDSTDFSYIDSEGNETEVADVQSRIDMVFIYSKPIDTSSVNILKASGKQTINAPTLGIVRGAGIKANFQETNNPVYDYLETLGDQETIIAAPGDSNNPNLGFTAASGNDISYDIRGSFPAPDDILNLAPLISEKLENNAIELVGQSILPVAYVWVQRDSQVVLSTDVIDIRPLFRTAELAYNERAGIAAAFPQLSLANPAVGQGQMDYEIRRVYNDLNGRLTNIEQTGFEGQVGFNTLATGYVFGGYHFGPEGALFDYWQNKLGLVNDPNGVDTVKQRVRNTFNFNFLGEGFDIPDKPDWDLANWCVTQNISSKGDFMTDYLNTFYSQRRTSENYVDDSIIAGAMVGQVDSNGFAPGPSYPERNARFLNNCRRVGRPTSEASFQYISKTINFNRPEWLADYHIDVDFVNCVAQNSAGGNNAEQEVVSYFGHWVEKKETSFTIYVAFNGFPPSVVGKTPLFAGPYTEFSNGTVVSSGRSAEKFSAGFLVPVDPLLYDNGTPVIQGNSNTEYGIEGSPRVGACTYPTISWKLTGIPQSALNYHYTNLNSNGPVIDLRSE